MAFKSEKISNNPVISNRVPRITFWHSFAGITAAALAMLAVDVTLQAAGLKGEEIVEIPSPITPDYPLARGYQWDLDLVHNSYPR